MKINLQHLDEFARLLTRKQARKLYESRFDREYDPEYVEEDEYINGDERFDKEFNDFELEGEPEFNDEEAIELTKKYDKEDDLEDFLDDAEYYEDFL